MPAPGPLYRQPVPELEAGKRSRNLDSNPSPRYLGLDVGNRRIGVAVSDELGLTAQPVLTLERSGSGHSRDDLRSLARLARRFSVVGIVVGNPCICQARQAPRPPKLRPSPPSSAN